MMTNPRIGQEVIVWYGKARGHLYRYHGKSGSVVTRFLGRGGKYSGPRNHLVEIDAVPVIVPCGYLRKKEVTND